MRCSWQEETQQRMVFTSVHLHDRQPQHDPVCEAVIGRKKPPFLSLSNRTVRQRRSIIYSTAPQMKSYALLALARWERE